jgi:probable DNA metabolism protein
MLVYTFDKTMDGILSAVFDAYFRHQQPDMLVGEGTQLPLFCEEVWQVVTTEEKASRVWTGLEKRLPREALHLLMVSWQSEENDLPTPLFHYIYKVFGTKGIERNFSDPDVLHVTNTARRVMHEQLRMKQFIRFQKAKDGTYLAVVSPDHNVLPLITGHFQDRFGDQSWLIYDAKRHYGFYYSLTPNPSPKGEGSFEIAYNKSHVAAKVPRISPMAKTAPFSFLCVPLFSRCSPKAIILPNPTTGWGSHAGSPSRRSSIHPKSRASSLVMGQYFIDFVHIYMSAHMISQAIVLLFLVGLVVEMAGAFLYLFLKGLQ